jgi:hypothetical protein
LLSKGKPYLIDDLTRIVKKKFTFAWENQYITPFRLQKIIKFSPELSFLFKKMSEQIKNAQE